MKVWIDGEITDGAGARIPVKYPGSFNNIRATARVR